MAAPQKPGDRPPGKSPPPSDHQPYVPADQHPAEFTWSAVIIGAVLGIIFGASSLYLVLKVGLTVSASIPVAVLSITLFRLFSRLTGARRATILENNMVQTVGSAGESIAFGVGVTMPALMILGYEMDIARVMVVASLGGLLGVLMMIPLRRLFIVRQHATLPYPEGTACADVLIAGEEGGSTAKTVFAGFGVAVIYTVMMKALRLWQDTPNHVMTYFKGASVGAEVTPELVGVGYIIGPKISCVMVAGGVLAYWVLIPIIAMFGENIGVPVFPAEKLINQMSPGEIRDAYVLYIGAGAVAAGGIISLLQAMPLIFGTLRGALKDALAARGEGKTSSLRTDRDLPMWVVFVGSLALIVAIMACGEMFGLGFNLKGIVGATLMVLFGFLFVTVSSRLTGQIGSSSNPISGMTVATLLLTCLIFVLLQKFDPNGEWIGSSARLTALSIAAVVCIASSNGGTTSQDLKTGYLVGATPRAQQIGLVVGVLSSALVIGGTLLLLNQASTVYDPRSYPEVRAPVQELKEIEQVSGPEAEKDKSAYHVWRVGDHDYQWRAYDGTVRTLPHGKYLVDDSGQIRYLVDPGINGTVHERMVNGVPQKIVKYDAPKARLMALIIDGILTQKLPWGLVLLGVSIALVLELCGVPSLPFAVGVYLPLSASAPIFVGGAVRWLADKLSRNTAADSEMSPGVLMSSGYIAGGTITGIGIALLALYESVGRQLDLTERFKDSPTFLKWTSNEWTSVAAFSVLVFILLAVGSERLFGSSKSSKK